MPGSETPSDTEKRLPGSQRLLKGARALHGGANPGSHSPSAPREETEGRAARSGLSRPAVRSEISDTRAS